LWYFLRALPFLVGYVLMPGDDGPLVDASPVDREALLARLRVAQPRLPPTPGWSSRPKGSAPSPEPASDAVAASFAGSTATCALTPSLLRLSEA
jgi:hypothetical protein